VGGDNDGYLNDQRRSLPFVFYWAPADIPVWGLFLHRSDLSQV
jgi:hypothetical protein